MMETENKVRQLVLAVTIVIAVLLSGCKAEKPEESDSEAKKLLLYCAAGIRPAVKQIVETFGHEHGVKIVTNYAGSEVLLSTIKLARQGDLYMPGDKYYVEQARQEGMILSQRSVCYWVPTILVQKGNPKNITGLEDLLQRGLKLGLGDANVCAIGRTTKQLFTKNNIAWDEVEKNLKFQSLTVNELGMQIQAKSLDAVIVWDAMARYYSDYGDQVPIAREKNVLSTVDVGVLKFTKHRKLAEKFVDFLVSEQGQGIFEKHNYRTTPPQ
jgi:molybdate transport system substrate-binding protein